MGFWQSIKQFFKRSTDEAVATDVTPTAGPRTGDYTQFFSFFRFWQHRVVGGYCLQMRAVA